MWSRRNGRGRTRALGAVTVAVTAVVTCATAAQAAGDDAGERAAAEYVVSFSGPPTGATAAIEAAGGAVQDVTEQVGLALVTSPDGTFPDRLQGQQGILGVARNHAVGTEHSQWLEQDISAPGVEMLRALFEGFDPGANLNPGKIVPGPRIADRVSDAT